MATAIAITAFCVHRDVIARNPITQPTSQEASSSDAPIVISRVDGATQERETAAFLDKLRNILSAPA